MGYGTLLSQGADVDFMIHGVFSDHYHTCVCFDRHADHHRFLYCSKPDAETCD